jgi:hypothetical protein
VVEEPAAEEGRVVGTGTQQGVVEPLPLESLLHHDRALVLPNVNSDLGEAQARIETFCVQRRKQHDARLPVFRSDSKELAEQARTDTAT